MIILNRPIYIVSSSGIIVNLSATQGLDSSIQNQPPIFVHYNQ